MSDLSEGIGEGYDGIREALGPPGNLKFKTFGPSQEPDTVLAEVTGWWKSESSRERVAVYVIEGAPLAGGGTLAAGHLIGEPAASLFEIDSLNYVIAPFEEGGVIPPTKEPRQYIVSGTLLGAQR